MIEKLIFVTGNKNKAKEAQAILGIPIDVVNIDLEEIQSANLKEVVQKKTADAFKSVGKPLLVDDVGFYVEAWNGFPGPFIKFMLAALGSKELARLIYTSQNLQVVVKACIGYHDGENIHTFLGEVPGMITHVPIGENGFGFDTIFIPKDQVVTFAQMSEEDKNKISHRARALEELKQFL